jgi:hypothetical protein
MPEVSGPHRYLFIPLNAKAFPLEQHAPLLLRMAMDLTLRMRLDAD